MKIVLYQPQIPQNAGNVARTCAVTGSQLTLVRPLGFTISNRRLKRAGLDYWDDVEWQVIDDLEAMLQNTGARFFFFSSKASPGYSEIEYERDDLLIFGSETTGLPDHFWEKWPDRFYTIPQRSGARCLNLSNSVAIVLYEALRQQQFATLKDL